VLFNVELCHIDEAVSFLHQCKEGSPQVEFRQFIKTRWISFSKTILAHSYQQQGLYSLYYLSNKEAPRNVKGPVSLQMRRISRF
jgi:hypothetical protein